MKRRGKGFSRRAVRRRMTASAGCRHRHNVRVTLTHRETAHFGLPGSRYARCRSRRDYVATLAWQRNAKRCSAIQFAGEIQRSIMKLDNAEGHRQTDAGAARFGAEEKRENLRPRLKRDSHTLVGNLEIEPIRIEVRRNLQLAAAGHRLTAVEYEIEQRLFHQVRVDTQPRYGAVGLEDQFDLVLPGLRFGKCEHLAHQGLHVELARAQLDRPGEIEKRLDHAIEPPQFVREDP